MSRDFEVVSLGITLDKELVFASTRNLSTPERVVFSGVVPPGDHVLHLSLRMVGSNELISRYHFEATSQHNLVVAAAGPAPDRLIVVAYEKDNVKLLPQPLQSMSSAPSSFDKFAERPALRFIEQSGNQPSEAPGTQPTRIWVSQTGIIELNGRPTDLDGVEKAINELTGKRSVFFAVDSAGGEIHANGVKIIEMLARKHVSVRMSTKRDLTGAFGEADAGPR